MICTRIKLARKKVGLSLRGLAEAIDSKVSAQAIGKYERGEMTPGSDVLIALSKALEVSIPYLMDTQSISLTAVDFRKTANTTAKDRARVETSLLEWVERYLQIEQLLDLDSAEWEKPINPPHPANNIEEAEHLAQTVRQNWELGSAPIPNMTELLEEKGLKVLIENLPDRVSGFTCLIQQANGKPELPVVVINRSKTLERRRLTLAHELAHRVIDPKFPSEKDEERFAQRFAGAFLMPRAHLEREVGKRRNALGYRELMDLKHIYRVSGAALLMRLCDIGIIDQGTRTYAFQTFACGWRTAEPNPIEPPEQSGTHEPERRFERLCYRALAEKLISVPKAAELLRRSFDEIEAGLKGPAQNRAAHCQ
jgi:Zn-dependent peptidase ImmA (M78 family)/DNA-binding XRE family transcriptional regulator